MPSSRQVSRHRRDLVVPSRCRDRARVATVTPRSANQATALRRTRLRGCGLGFVVVDLGVGDPGVVVDDGVQESRCRSVESEVSRREACQCARRWLPVLLSPVLAPDVAPAPAVGTLRSFLTSSMDHVAGLFVLVTADRLSSLAVDVRESVDASKGPGPRARSRRSSLACQRSGPGGPRAMLPAQVYTILRTMGCGVLFA